MQWLRDERQFACIEALNTTDDSQRECVEWVPRKPGLGWQALTAKRSDNTKPPNAYRIGVQLLRRLNIDNQLYSTSNWLQLDDSL